MAAFFLKHATSKLRSKYIFQTAILYILGVPATLGVVTIRVIGSQHGWPPFPGFWARDQASE